MRWRCTRTRNVVPALLAAVLPGCVGSTSSEAVSGSFNLNMTGVVPETVTADEVWCGWAADNSHIDLHIRFRNAGTQDVKLNWDATGAVVDGVDSSALFNRIEMTDVPAGKTVVVDATVGRPSRVEPGAVLTSCEPRQRWGKPDPNTEIVVTGSIGGVHMREIRAQVQRLLGPGQVVSATHRHPKNGGDYTLTGVLYPASLLEVVYLTSAGRSPVVFGIDTTSRRYHATHGLSVGSSLAAARHEPGVRCYEQPGYTACQGGVGYQKPTTTRFTVLDGTVTRVFIAAVAALPATTWQRLSGG